MFVVGRKRQWPVAGCRKKRWAAGKYGDRLPVNCFWMQKTVGRKRRWERMVVGGWWMVVGGRLLVDGRVCFVSVGRGRDGQVISGVQQHPYRPITGIDIGIQKVYQTSPDSDLIINATHSNSSI